MEPTFLSNKSSELYTKMEAEYVTHEVAAFLKNKKFPQLLNLTKIKLLIDAQFSKQILSIAEASLEPMFSQPISKIILAMANLDIFEVKTTLNRIHVMKSLEHILTNKIQERIKFLVSPKCDEMFYENISKWNEQVFDSFAKIESEQSQRIVLSIEQDVRALVPRVHYRTLRHSHTYFVEYISREMFKKLQTFFGSNFEVIHGNEKEYIYNNRCSFLISVKA